MSRQEAEVAVVHQEDHQEDLRDVHQEPIHQEDLLQESLDPWRAYSSYIPCIESDSAVHVMYEIETL